MSFLYTQDQSRTVRIIAVGVTYWKHIEYEIELPQGCFHINHLYCPDTCSSSSCWMEMRHGNILKLPPLIISYSSLVVSSKQVRGAGKRF